MVCLTGVSGSGKSTLVQDVLHAALLQAKGKPTEAPGRHRALRGHQYLSDVVLVDQTPIGRTTRSNPASYVGAFDAIRNLYARAPLARERAYTTGTFSSIPATAAARPAAAMATSMSRCNSCPTSICAARIATGRRYRAEILEVTLRGKSIADILELTVSEACRFFTDEAGVLAALAPLSDVASII